MENQNLGNFVLTETPQTAPKYAHPVEEAFTRILDFYGIQWLYEPRTFPLEWDANGNIIDAFTPDFYLPEQDLYIELTTLRPKLANYKNRRVRRMHELYPDIQVKLFKRRDLRNLLIKFGLLDEAQKITGTDAQKSEDERPNS